MSKLVPISIFLDELYAAYKRGDGYIMGSRGQNPRTGSLDLSVTKEGSNWKPTGWFYTQYSGNQKTQALKWREKCTRVWDCNGMAEGIYEIHTGVKIDTRARYNYSGWCSPKGAGMIPTQYRMPGAAVFWGKAGDALSIHHVAYLYKPVIEGHPEGDWYIIEARGVMYGVVMTKLNSRKPNYWGLMTKYYDYSANGDTEYVEEPKTTKIYKNGMTGSVVKTIQTQLIELGYDLGSWGADGDFGDCTEMAVRQFQQDRGLEVDGKVGEQTFAALQAAQAQKKQEQENSNSQIVVIKNGNCYVRTLPNTSGKPLGVAYRDTELPYGGAIDENTHWVKVIFEGKEGWVSNKYGTLK